MNDAAAKTGIIAIVDDDGPLREALGSVLKAAGFPTSSFASAEEFLASGDRQNTACLILDVRLPGMSGIELQRQLASSHGGVPVVFVTAHGDTALRESLLRAGAAGFLNKPVRSEALLRAIRMAFEKNQSQQEEQEI
jgi:FixJ family two-component response regulator